MSNISPLPKIVRRNQCNSNNTKKVLFDDDIMVPEQKKIIYKQVEHKEHKEYDQINEVFDKYFPGKKIKQLQYDIVKSVMNGNDTIAILPTGYGKSMCYQLPFLMDKNKVVIVISPLISLMEDQKEKLEKLNIPVTCFHSNINKTKKQEIKTELLENLLSNSIKYRQTDKILNISLTSEIEGDSIVYCFNKIDRIRKTEKFGEDFLLS